MRLLASLASTSYEIVEVHENPVFALVPREAGWEKLLSLIFRDYVLHVNGKGNEIGGCLLETDK